MTSTDCHTPGKSNPQDPHSKALKIFHKASAKLPKYAETIKRISGLTPKEIKSFGQIPIVTKKKKRKNPQKKFKTLPRGDLKCILLKNVDFTNFWGQLNYFSPKHVSITCLITLNRSNKKDFQFTIFPCK